MTQVRKIGGIPAGYQQVEESFFSRALKATRYLFGSKSIRLFEAVGQWKPGAASKADSRGAGTSADKVDVPHGDAGIGAKGKR